MKWCFCTDAVSTVARQRVVNDRVAATDVRAGMIAVVDCVWVGKSYRSGSDMVRSLWVGHGTNPWRHRAGRLSEHGIVLMVIDSVEDAPSHVSLMQSSRRGEVIF